MITYLLSKSSIDRFRFAIVETNEEWSDTDKGYVIQRSYGQVGGKTSLSPAIIVNKTNQNRTWKQQLQLQYEHEVKKFLDKGYIKVDKHPNDYTIQELEDIFGNIKTDQMGIIKPQLAKQVEKVTNKNIFNRLWLSSRKIDGVKALFYYKNGEIHTASRGGGDYDASTSHLTSNEALLTFFKKWPTVILDGELYKHGKSLQQISSAARMEVNAYDCDWLTYVIYDCYLIDKPEMVAADRYALLTEELGVPLYPYNEDSVVLLEHVPVSGWDNIMKLHDQYVEEGYEGECLTDPICHYKPGSRGNQLLKVKSYQDAEFKVTGISEGLRDEDMCFTLITSDGQEFKAKPMGSRELKQQYRQDINSIIGKMATVKFFYYSDTGVPLQPVLKCIRDYDT